MNALDCLMTRRSTRQYAARPVEEAALAAVLEAGRHAPSGGNSQTTHFIVAQNPQVLAKLAELVQAEFAKMEVTEGMYRSMVNSITRSKAGGYVFHYNAPVLVITANQADYGNNIADCACALENMMLAANALELGSCWINQLRWLNENQTLLQYLRSLGLAESERVYGALALGYAADGLPSRTPLPRTGNPITYIR